MYYILCIFCNFQEYNKIMHCVKYFSYYFPNFHLLNCKRIAIPGLQLENLNVKNLIDKVKENIISKEVALFKIPKLLQNFQESRF